MFAIGVITGQFGNISPFLLVGALEHKVLHSMAIRHAMLDPLCGSGSDAVIIIARRGSAPLKELDVMDYYHLKAVVAADSIPTLNDVSFAAALRLGVDVMC